jgi:hypothetical protein
MSTVTTAYEQGNSKRYYVKETAVVVAVVVTNYAMVAQNVLRET